MLEPNIFSEALQAIREIIQDNGKVIEEYLREFNVQPAVQLFGVSQAGKSTLISCLTLGEQWIPIGTGTATTAVKIELISVDSLDKARAEIKWLTKEELLDLVMQPPMDTFIQAVMSKDILKDIFSNIKSLISSDALNQNRKDLTLDSKEDRKLLQKALEAAKRERENNGGNVGEFDSLAIVEVILSYYEEYLKKFTTEIITLKGKFLSQISKWTRQPHQWTEIPISNYSFDDLQSFFTKEVRLYVPTQDAVNGLRILDTPGFGVNLLHNKICREAQREAKAIILVLGSQLTLDNLEEIKQLKTGMSDSQSATVRQEESIKSRLGDNIFIIWNQKEGTKENARNNLDKMLKRLQQEVNITISPDRVAIVNLRLALRAMQYEKIQTGQGLSPSTYESLFQIFVNDYTKIKDINEEGKKQKAVQNTIAREMKLDRLKFDDEDTDIISDIEQDTKPNYLELSGWNDVFQLIKSIKDSQKQIQTIELAAKILELLKNYIQKFPTPEEQKQKTEQLKILEYILARFEKKTGLIRNKMIEEVISQDESILNDFLGYLTDNKELINLKTRIKDLIDSELYFTNVPGKIKEKLIDYVDARCSAWIRDFIEFNTSGGKELVLGSYKESVDDFKIFISDKIQGKGFENLILPTAVEPSIDLDYFRTLFKEWSDQIIRDTFNLSWLDQIGITFAEMGNEIGYQGERFGKQINYAAQNVGAWWNNLWSEDKKTVTQKVTERKPNFDRTKAFESAKEKIDNLLSSEIFLEIYEQGKRNGLIGPTLYEQAMPELFDGNSIPRNLEIQEFIPFIMKGSNILFGAISQAFINDKCKKFCRSWKESQDATLKAVNASFTNWTTHTQSLLKGRSENLSKLDPLIEVEDLKKIETTVNQLKSLPSLNVQATNNELSNKYKICLINVEKSIEDRKTN
jgi:hypothetical protein